MVAAPLFVQSLCLKYQIAYLKKSVNRWRCVAGRRRLLFMHLLAVCVWVGGFVAIAVVTRAVRRELSVAARVALFRSLGRSCGIVGGLALGVALLTGGGLLSQRG
jgi:hypothetical protein